MALPRHSLCMYWSAGAPRAHPRKCSSTGTRTVASSLCVVFMIRFRAQSLGRVGLCVPPDYQTNHRHASPLSNSPHRDNSQSVGGSYSRDCSLDLHTDYLTHSSIAWYSIHPCMHWCCEVCLREWMVERKKNICPVCRTKIKFAWSGERRAAGGR